MQKIIVLFLFLFQGCMNPNVKKNDNVERQNNVFQEVFFIDENFQEISKSYLLGKFNPEKDSMFINVPKEYCLYRDEFLLKEVFVQYEGMYKEAAKDGILLKIVSAFRSFEVQKWLWERKIKSDNPTVEEVYSALKYSAMPGTSRHHWGTDVDLCNLSDIWFSTQEGEKTYNWLLNNAHKFGFFQPYTANRNVGYNEEKWHWSYKPIATEYLNAYKRQITDNDITGFKGSTLVKYINIIKNYVEL